MADFSFNQKSFNDFFFRSIRKGHHWGLLGIGAASVYHFLLSKQVKSHMKETVTIIDGKPETAGTETILRADDVKKALEWSKLDGVVQKPKEIPLFPSKLLDMSHKGCMQLTCGAAVGVPANFTSNFMKEVKENPSLLHQYSIDVTTEAGRQMYELLKQKDKEIVRLYALAREMCEVKCAQHVFVMGGIVAAFSSCFHIAKALTVVLRFRILSYLVTLPSMVYGSLQGYDFLNRQYEKVLDKEAASVSKFAAVGGVEYFDYLIAKEQLLKGSSVETDSSHDEFYIVHYLNPSQWLLEYRKPKYTLQQRRRMLLAMIAKVYNDNSEEQTKAVDMTEQKREV